VLINNGSSCEVCSYTGTGAYDSVAGGYPLSGLTRRTTVSIAGLNHLGTFNQSAYSFTGTSSNVVFTPDASVGGAGTNQVSVISLRNTCSPLTRQFGLSLSAEGRYLGRGNQCSTGMIRYANVTASNLSPLLALRMAPSTDTQYTGNVGVRSIINRLAPEIKEVGITSQGQFSIEGYFNPATVTGNTLADFTAVEQNSLSEIIYFNGTSVPGAPVNASANITGGYKVFSFYTDSSGTSSTDFRSTVYSPPDVVLGSSIESGGMWFPEGPETLVICARNLSATNAANIACRVVWEE